MARLPSHLDCRRAGPLHSANIILKARKPLVIVAGLALCVLAIDYIGFIAAVSLYLCYLLGIIERCGWKTTFGVGIGATLVIFVLFRSWLGVPLPLGFFGA